MVSESIAATTSTAAGRRVLLVEDDTAMAAALGHGFTYEGFAVDHAADGPAALARAGGAPPDIIILDVMLPKLSGLDVCKRLRAGGNNVPIIMLTARGQEIDKIVGLRMGADDYLTKPFSFMELIARVEAVLRRVGSGSEAPTPAPAAIRFGDVTMDLRRHELIKGRCKVPLSPRELHLLAYLYEHRGEVLSREHLLDAVWGYNVMPFTRTVDTHIAKLRKKIEDTPSDPRHLLTVHRVGYKLAV